MPNQWTVGRKEQPEIERAEIIRQDDAFTTTLEHAIRSGWEQRTTPVVEPASLIPWSPGPLGVSERPDGQARMPTAPGNLSFPGGLPPSAPTSTRYQPRTPPASARYFTAQIEAAIAAARKRPGQFTLIDLRGGQCRFPVGTSPFLFCGKRVIEDSSYCREHHQKTHEPFRTRREGGYGRGY